jgi:hypothetical protein
MTDIVEELNRAMFCIKDETRISADLWMPLAIAICEATDEIKRMRWALQFILGLERIEDAHVAALAALERKK